MRWNRRCAALVLTAALVALALPSCEKAVERGTQQAVEKKIDEKLSGGGTADLAYGDQLVFDLKGQRAAEGVMVSGLVRNNGSKPVIFLKVAVALLDKDGVQVAGRTDLFAHTFPFGENNTPIMPKAAKRVEVVIDDGGRWTAGAVSVAILELRVQ